MISKSKSPSDEYAARWAAEQLGVTVGASAEDCTKAFLRQLEEEDFVPPAPLRKAWEYLAGTSIGDASVPSWVEAEAEEEISVRVEQFAAQFFKHSREERTRQWKELHAKAARWPRLEMRLRQLKPGLAVEIPALSNLGARESLLIQWTAELFPLPPERRAVHRLELLRKGVIDDMRYWEQAARSVEGQQPALAAIGQDLLAPMANWSRNLKEAKEIRHWRGVAAKHVQKEVKRAAAKPARSGLQPFAWWSIAFCLAIFARMVIGEGDSPTPNAGPLPRWAQPGSPDYNDALKQMRQADQNEQDQQSSSEDDAKTRRGLGIAFKLYQQQQEEKARQTSPPQQQQSRRDPVEEGAELAAKYLEIRKSFPNDDAGARNAMKKFLEENSSQASPADAGLRKAGELVTKELLEQKERSSQAPPAATSAPQPSATNPPAAPKNSAGQVP